MSMTVTAGAAPQAPSRSPDSAGTRGDGRAADVDDGLREDFERALEGGDRERAGRDGRRDGDGSGGQFGGDGRNDPMAGIFGGTGDGAGTGDGGVPERTDAADGGRMPGGPEDAVPQPAGDVSGWAGRPDAGLRDDGPAESGWDGEGLPSDAPVLPSPESLLQGLFGPVAPPPPDKLLAAAQADAPVPAGPASSEEIVSRLVERILVSEPGRGDPEVRISLGEGALAGTEVRLSRSHDGLLTVHLDCSHESAFQTAVAARNGLVAALEKDGGDVRVEVRRQDDAGGGNEGDSRRRSATWQEARPDGDER